MKSIMKRRLLKNLLVSLFIVMIAVSQSFTLSADVTGYTLTSELTVDDKVDSTQANYQEDTGDYTYTTSLIQTAEWTDKENGEAEINITHTADFSEIGYQERVLYVFTTEAGFGLYYNLVATNIRKLLEYYEYVDVIMLAGTNRTSADGYGESMATAKFSMFRSDFYTGDYDTDEIDSEILTILEARHYDLSIVDDEKVHAIGSTDPESKGVEEVLYYSNSYNKALDMLINSAYRMIGSYLSLHYIQEYYDIITESYPNQDFTDVVDAIYNSLDGTYTLRYNSSAGYSTTYIYQYMESLLGLDMDGEEVISLSTLTSDNSPVKEAADILVQYDEEGRYVVLLNDPEYMYDTYHAFGYQVTGYWWFNSPISSISIQNELLYLIFLINPSGTMENEDDVKNTLAGWAEQAEEALAIGTTEAINEIIYEFTGTSDPFFGDDVYMYQEDFITLGFYDAQESDDKTVTITTTINSQFYISGDITVSHSTDGGDSFDDNYTISTSTNDDGDTVVTVTFTGDVNVDAIDTHTISIPVTLKDTSSFCTVDDDFEITNTQDTQVTLTRVTTFTAGAPITYTEHPSVESTALYKASPTVIIVDTSTL